MDVSIIIPVFGAPNVLSALLDTLNQNCAAEQQIVLIDDGSECSEIDSLIARFCLGGRRRHWIKERENRGFVATANLGFCITTDHVVLLNSDTMVTPGWIENMTCCLASDPTIATVTPWSNNAEICSFPHFVTNNPVPSNPARVAEIISTTGAPEYPTLPTAVGFCMLIRREVLDLIGGFDVETFGKGYGEENDFSQRAREAGYRNVLCDTAYVVHVGGASFAKTGLRPGPDSMRRLLAKHPGYQTEVADFIASDPLRHRREALRSALSRAQVTA